MNTKLMKRAVILFPRTDYNDHAAVRHARRAWLRSVEILRGASRSMWILDNPVAKIGD